MMRRTVLLLLMGLAGPLSASGQSLLNAAGLGVPLDPVDARTRAMGGVGIGLQGPTLLRSDPAAAAGFLLPTIQITAQPSWVQAGRSSLIHDRTFRGTRFPSLGIAYPVAGKGVVTLAFESVLDQRYEAEQPATVDLGEGPIEVTDQFKSEGGVSQARLGFAKVVAKRLALGVSAGRYTGSLTRSLTRDFGDGTNGEPVEPYRATGLWTYSGATLTGGASLALGTFAQVGGSVTWSSALTAEPSTDTEGGQRVFDMPLQLRVGATAVLAPGLSIAGGFTSADWSAVDNDLAEGRSTGSGSSYGVGLELTRAQLLGKSAPLRLGYHHRNLPFALASQGGATEAVWAGGLGLHLARSGQFVLAALDVALERGTRKDEVFSESFWRGTVTVRISGF